MRKKRMKYTAILMCLGLIGCTTASPYIDTHSGVAGGRSLSRSTPDKVAICFDETDMDILQEMANKECAKTSRKAIFDKIVPFSCSLTTPSTAYFDCK
jgi:hypothetical protein